jgi:hypothetical protein
MTLGPIQPDYGSYFGLAEANINDVPFSKAWTDYIETHLDTNAIPGSFTGVDRMNAAGPTPAEELTANLRNYEAVGVRYVVETSNGLDVQGQSFPAAGSPPWPSGPRLVYRDNFAEVWQLPSATPVFSLLSVIPKAGTQTAQACTVTGVGWDRATVICPHRSILVRRVQFVSGWTATINGSPVDVREDQTGPPGLFQAISIPPGRTTIHFTYLPPHETAAFAAAIAALLLLVGSLIDQRFRPPRTAVTAHARSGRRHKVRPG